MRKYKLAALAAAGFTTVFAAGSASAADLGGNCCADLEERIAELEATTARKGNRKVSLTISGWVGQQIMFWDDGAEKNTYVHDLGSTIGSHFKFAGQANIMPGWTAGYVLHVEAVSNDSLSIDADNPRAGGGVSVLQSYWFLKSDQLGKVSVGKQSQSADNAAILVDGSGSVLTANWVAFDTDSFGIRFKSGAQSGNKWGGNYCQSWGGAWGDCDGVPRNVVRYDTPSFAGFSASASWGEDDIWDVAGRYTGEFTGFWVAAAVAYSESSDEAFNGGFVGDTQKYLQGGLYVEHIPTGLFALGNYGHDDFDATAGSSETWYAKGGIRQRWTPFGHTILYGEYLKAKGDLAFSQSFLNGLGTATDDQTRVWGVGVVQEIDAAAMSVWVKYRNLNYDDNSGFAYDDFQYVGVGGLINF